MHLPLILLATLFFLTMASPETPVIITPPWVPSNDPDHPWRVITTYLTIASSPNTTAQTLVQLPPQNPTGDHTIHIFKSILEISTFIPHTHPWHQFLATLLLEIKSQPPPPPSIIQEFRNSTRYQKSLAEKDFTWADLPTFDSQQFGFFVGKNRISSVNREGVAGTQDPFTSSEWFSFNAFLALLVSQDIPPTIDTAQTGLRVLSSVLEKARLEQPDRPDEWFLQDNIPSAAIWIMTAGTWMNKYEGGDLEIKARHFFGMEVGPVNLEWGIWEERLWEVSGRMDLSSNTRQWALKGAYYLSGREV